MRVAQVLGTGAKNARGIALTALNLADLLDPHRYSLSVLFLGEAGPIGDSFRKSGVDVKAIGWHRGRADIRGAMRFARALRSLEPDIVHLHAGGMSPRLVSKIAAGAKVIVHYHSLEEESKTTGATRRSPLAADLIIANSEATARSVKRAKPLVVYPGVKPHSKNGQKPARDKIVVGVAARLAKVKGIEYLIEAVSQLENVELEIAGDGPERLELERLVRDLRVVDRVRFTGWVDDISEVMARWDVYAQPSTAEGLGVAALEAMAAGIPVVASNVGGLREIVVDGETGFLVTPKSATELASKIQMLASDAALRKRVGDNARTRVARDFSRERECAAIQSAYETLLA